MAAGVGAGAPTASGSAFVRPSREKRDTRTRARRRVMEGRGGGPRARATIRGIGAQVQSVFGPLNVRRRKLVVRLMLLRTVAAVLRCREIAFRPRTPCHRSPKK